MEEDLFKKQTLAPKLDDLARALAEANTVVSDLQNLLSEARKLERLLGDLSGYRDRAWPLHIRALCEKEKDFLKTLREKDHPAIPVVEALYRDIKPRAERSISALPGDMERVAKQAGLKLDFSRSGHPRYYFENDGFIEVEINDKRFEAKLSTREGFLAKLPADGGAIIDAVKREKERLFGRPFKGAAFLKDLRTAYNTGLLAKKAPDGDPVPIREVFEAMTRKIKARKGYKSDEFLVDLSSLVVEGPPETQGRRFELQQTKDTKEGMLLLGEAGRGMVNLLIFRKPSSSES